MSTAVLTPVASMRIVSSRIVVRRSCATLLCVCRAGVIVDELVAVFGGFRVFGRFVRLFRKANFKAVRTGRTDVLVVGIHACFAQQCTLQKHPR